MKMSICPKTPIKIHYIEHGDYKTVTSSIGKTTTDTFFCKWITSYGNIAVQNQALGINEEVVVRMIFNPTVFETLNTKTDIVIAKNAQNIFKGDVFDYGNNNLYVASSNVENMREESLYMEFKVKRYGAI